MTAGRPARDERDGIQAVMFDMDGLLVDTEPLWLEVETEIVARLGTTWSHADQAELLGGSLAKSVSYMLGKAAPAPPDGAGAGGEWPPAAETVAAWMVGGMVAQLANRGVALLPGAGELLAEISAAGVPRALVTSSERSVMEAVLAHNQARTLFDVTVCAADVSRTKPDPEPYLRAADLLGVDPARCVVLEDAPNGVAAAQAAGCLTVMVPNVAAAPPAPAPPRHPPGDGSGFGGETGVTAPGRHHLVVSSLRDISLAWLREQMASWAAPTP